MGHPTVGEDYQVTSILVIEKDSDMGLIGAEFKFTNKIDFTLNDACKEFHFNI